MAKKKIIFIGLILVSVVFISGCVQESEDIEESEFSDVISECDSLCRVDANDYCEQERTFVVNDIEITGTCRGLSKQIQNFNKCKGFCKEFEKSGTVLSIKLLLNTTN